MTLFARYIGVDYSGAKTPSDSLSGLRIYEARGRAEPVEVPPPPSPRKYWNRREIAHWLVEQLASGEPTLVGIDHGFSFPVQYFKKHNLALDWSFFLEDFSHHWPTDGEHMYVDFIRDGSKGNGAARTGNNKWRRLTEQRAGSAKSAFHFDVQGSVAKSTHAGLPWLLFIRKELGAGVHFWPFDGWKVPAQTSVIAEVYPRLWSKSFAPAGRTPDQHDAYSVAAWLTQADREGRLGGLFDPQLPAAEKEVARIEGWILGVPAGGGKDSSVGASGTGKKRSARSSGVGGSSGVDTHLANLAGVREELVRHLADVIRGLWSARTAQFLAAQIAAAPGAQIPVAGGGTAITLAELDTTVAQFEIEEQRLREAIEAIDVRLERVTRSGNLQ